MHITEGVLSLPVLATGAALTVAGTAIGLKKIDPAKLIQVAILSAFFFAVGSLHIPVGPFSIHLMLTGVLGMILGWIAFPAILVSLVLQALFFHEGGLTALGVNTLCIAGPAVVCRYLLAWLPHSSGKAHFFAGFLSGATATALTGLLAALAVGLSDHRLLLSGQALALFHIPLVLTEGCLGGFITGFLYRVRPDALGAFSH